ncbi:MAG: hypothetical protein WDZ91_00045, partial [Paenibacillaceae bacterium]
SESWGLDRVVIFLFENEPNMIYEQGGQVLNFHPGWVQSYMSGELNTAAAITADESAADLVGLMERHREFAGPTPAFIDHLGTPQLW